jgi:hypothetical protein
MAALHNFWGHHSHCKIFYCYTLRFSSPIPGKSFSQISQNQTFLTCISVWKSWQFFLMNYSTLRFTLRGRSIRFYHLFIVLKLSPKT